jgi:hypothetical protein
MGAGGLLQECAGQPKYPRIAALKSVAMISFLCAQRQTLAQASPRVEKSVLRELKQNP